MSTRLQQSEKTREISEIVRRNVKEVIQTLLDKGFEYQQHLIKQYVNGEKSQYEFLLPKSKNYRYYTQQLAAQIETKERQRKTSSMQFQQKEQPQPILQHKSNQNLISHNSPQTMLIVGTVQQVSVGAMCQLIKELRQDNNQPYTPFDDQVYEQQLTMNLSSLQMQKKIQPILTMIQALKSPQKQKQTGQLVQLRATTKVDMVRGQLNTREDGSMGSWGGKKYEGLGMRNQFTDYRKQASKSFYQSIR